MHPGVYTSFPRETGHKVFLSVRFKIRFHGYKDLQLPVTSMLGVSCFTSINHSVLICFMWFYQKDNIYEGGGQDML